MRFLGHTISDDASCHPCLNSTIASMFGCFWRNVSAGLRRAKDCIKIRFIQNIVRSIASYRWARWPYSTMAAAKLDSAQRRMLGWILEVKPRPTETIADFVRRRQLTTGRIASKYGRYSTLWLTDLRKWESHVLRQVSHPELWSVHLYQWHNHEWLNRQRSLASASGESRTGLRSSQPGRVQPRWEASLRQAPDLRSV